MNTVITTTITGYSGQDPIAEYQAGERRVRFWLEWDRGNMSTRDLTTKCQIYAHYVASREWLKEKATLPSSLIVTPERDQEMRLHEQQLPFSSMLQG